jgi:hypothetical protein
MEYAVNQGRLKIFIALTLGIVLCAFGLWFWYLNYSAPLWDYDSNSQNGLEETSLDYHAEILEDYFLYDRLGESLHYKHVHSITQNSEKPEPAMIEAFNHALNEVFKGKVRPPEAMIILAQGSLFEKFNRSFLKDLHDKEIKTGQIHWSLRFVPEQHLNLSYSEHIENNQVIKWEANSKWAPQLQTEEQSLQKKLDQLTIPGNGRPFQYLAGAIHYHLNLDKLNKPNSDIGRLVFRKYYRMDNGHTFRQTFASSGFQLEHMRLKSENKSPLITVDFLETFSLQEIEPRPKRINLNFSGVVEERSSENVNLNHNNNLTIVGELSTVEHDKVLFEMRLTNLSFNIEQKTVSTLNEKKSLYQIKILPEGLKLKDSSLFKHQIKNKILREHQRDLLRSLNTSLISTTLMGEVNL